MGKNIEDKVLIKEAFYELISHNSNYKKLISKSICICNYENYIKENQSKNYLNIKFKKSLDKIKAMKKDEIRKKEKTFFIIRLPYCEYSEFNNIDYDLKFIDVTPKSRLYLIKTNKLTRNDKNFKIAFKKLKKELRKEQKEYLNIILQIKFLGEIKESELEISYTFIKNTMSNSNENEK